MKILSTSVALAVFSAAMWFGWLGWDHEYYEVDGHMQGPYRPWQVVGCAVTLAVGAFVAYGLVRRVGAVLPLAAAGALGFAVPWAVDAARTDDSGLWIVGLVLLLGGATAGLLVVLGVAALVLKEPLRHHGRPSLP